MSDVWNVGVNDDISHFVKTVTAKMHLGFDTERF